MLVIRLLRIGKKNASSFRIVLTEKRNASKSGRFLEALGSYNPRLRVEKKDNVAGGKKIVLKKERIEYWLSQGAKASETVHNLLVSQGVVKGPKIAKKIRIKKGKSVAEGEQQPVEKKKEAVESGEEESKAEKKAEDEKPAEDAQPKEKPAEEKKEKAPEEKEDTKKEIK